MPVAKPSTKRVPSEIVDIVRTTRVMFTDCATGREFASEEPTFVPQDDVCCVAVGTVEELVTDENASDFGRHVVVAHRWPRSGEWFVTLYGHLAEVAEVSVGAAIDAQLGVVRENGVLRLDPR